MKTSHLSQLSKVIFVTIMILSGFQSISAQTSDFHKGISTYTDQILNSLVHIRRDLHQHPELSGQEVKTSEVVVQYLQSSGLTVKSNIGGYGVLGILKGKNPGPCVAWRSDMDAFADGSPDVVDFASKVDGVRHICGHDIHTVIGLGIAKVLSENRDRLNGTIMFLFQPSEENFLGAKAMIDDGVLNTIKPDVVLALHVGPMPEGIIAIKTNEMFAHRIELLIKLKETKNEESLVKDLSTLLEEINKPESQSIFDVDIGDQKVGLFSPSSVLMDYFQTSSRISTEVDKEKQKILFKIDAWSSSLLNITNSITTLKKLFDHSPLSKNLESITYSYKQPIVFNDPQITDYSIRTLKSIYGEQTFVPLFGIMPNFNDDFAFFMAKTKGVYFFLGGSNFSKGIISMPHSPNFTVDENCIKKGVNYFSSLIYELVNNPKELLTSAINSLQYGI